MQTLRHLLKYIMLFLTVVTVLTALLAICACIPKSAIRENMLESARFLQEGELFGTVVEGVEGSKIDRYADSILLGIAWQYDSEDPMRAIMLSSYYHAEQRNENENLLNAVLEGLGPNQQYLRYWHGSNVIVRVLLMVFSIEQIYLLNGIILAVLTVLLLVLLYRKKACVPAAGVGLGLVLTASWFVPLSLEYTWTYLLMLAGSIVAVKLVSTGKWQYMGSFFLLNGMLTNYLDFLTTETLTLLVPLLLVLWFQRQEAVVQSARNAAKAVCFWGWGYAGMWITKWILASAVLEENVLPYVTGHVYERLGGELGLSLWRYMTGAVQRNVQCLFPLEYGTLGLLATLALVVFATYVGYVYQKKKIRWEKIALFAVLGLIPYVRFLILHNHAWLHCFFTYRAQLATVVAVVMIVAELTDWRWRGLGNAGKGKS